MVTNIWNTVYGSLLDWLNQGFRAALVTRLPSSPEDVPAPVKNVLFEDGAGTIQIGPPSSGPASRSEPVETTLLPHAKSAIASGRPVLLPGPWETFIEPFWPEPRLLVLGGGHIALPLVEMAAMLGFAVTVVDDRPSYANASRFPAASQVVCDSFDRAIRAASITGCTFVVIATRGHAHDLVCLRECLKRDAAYTGMVASRRRAREIRTLLEAEGYSSGQLDHLLSPAGLNIGAVTPEEVALSILSQMVSVKRFGSTGPADWQVRHRDSWPQPDKVLLRELARDSAETRAAVTVLSTRGSTPREAGARMIVWADGRTLGSIGGGCVEARAAQIARDVALQGGWSRCHCDLTADAAAEEGMACGGVMDLLIEPV